MQATVEHKHSLREMKEEKLRRKLKGSFPAFFRMHPPARNYIFGRCFDEVDQVLDSVTKDVEKGICRYVCLCIPVRQGKSDRVSRRWKAWNMIRNPDWEQILISYAFGLASEFSFDIRSLIRDAGAWYGLRLTRDRGAVDSWSLAGSGGKLHCAGIGGTITGRGAVILTIDDPYKNRKEAESITVRQNVWEAFESDLLTRLAPVHAVVIVMNRWHSDDVIGRIENKNDPDHEDYDPDFPIFEMHSYPAQNEEGEWLFPERFSNQWYRTLRAFLGTYAWQSQGLQSPVNRGGNLFQMEGLVEVPLSAFPDTPYVRFWDLASTEQERTGHKPSGTAGAKVGVTKDREDLLPSIWIKDVKFCKEEAPKRDRLILATTQADGASVPVLVESVAGYKDAFTTLKAMLKGKRTVRKVTVSRDKVTNASVLEPLFEAARVFVPEGAPWLPLFRQHFSSFPGGDNDDIVDAVSGGYRHAVRKTMFSDLKGIDRMALGF